MSNQIEKSFSDFIKESLNKPQHKAATKKKGSLLVIAGAGSGKTRVITSRITNLILNEKADPSSIVALTFTNKAAGEMKERITKFLGAHHELPFVGTFHSYCLFLLRSNPSLLPFPQFSIMDSDDRLSLIKKIVKQNAAQKYATPSQLSYQLSQIKNALYEKKDDDTVFGHPIIKEIYLAYESEKSAAKCFDFDDLILQVLSLFETNNDFKKRFQEKIKHVLVDEYQDTSHTQHELLKHMGLNEKGKTSLTSLCAVGDEDQSIYSWRGATVTNMLKFKKDFAPVTTVKIEQNYRSVSPILEAANSLIENNKLRNPKNLWSEKKAKGRIVSLSCRSGEHEADIVATFAKTLGEKKKLSNVAMLYRTHFQSRVLEEALIFHGIPYRIIGGIRFYERREIKDLLAYLRLITNQFDKISLMRVINTPARGLGAKFEEALTLEWMRNPFFNFKEVLQHLYTSDDVKMTASKKKSVQEFLAIYNNLTPFDKPSYLIDAILERTDYLNHLRRTLDAKEADTKIENIQEFLRSISLYEQNAEAQAKGDTQPQPLLENFLFEVSLLQEKIDEKDLDDQVQLMTLHAAKGLEFDTVIITGLEEGLLPSSKSLNTNEELEEERRLFYVGITRAKEYLLLTHAGYRNSFGQIVDQVQSRFLTEIDSKLLRTINAEEYDATTLRNELRRWIGMRTPDSTLMTFGKPRMQSTGYTAKIKRGPSTSSKSSTKKPAYKKRINFSTRIKIKNNRFIIILRKLRSFF